MSEAEQESVYGVGILVAAFPNEYAGEEALKALKDAKKERKVYFEDAAVISQDAEGGVHYHETGDMSTGKGAGVGALVGGVIGILGGPAGIVIGAGAGALIGGAAAHGDAGFDDEGLEQLGSALQPGSSAIAAVTHGEFLHEVRKQVSDADMRDALASLGSELSMRLGEGKSVAIGLALTEDRLAVKEVAADDAVAEVIGIVVTEDGVIGGAAVVSDDGIAYAVGAATEEGAVAERGVVTEEGAVVQGAVTDGEEVVGGTAVITPAEEAEAEGKKEE